jgi:outer membrane protein
VIKSLFRVFLVAILCAPAIAFAEAAPAPASGPQKIGTLNTSRALQETNAYKTAMDGVLAEYKNDIEEAKRLERELAALQEKATKDAATMNNTQRAQLQREAVEKQERLQAIARKVQSARQEKASEIAQQLDPLLRRVVPEIAAAGGYTIILDQGAVVISGPTIDITRAVIERLNAGN